MIYLFLPEGLKSKEDAIMSVLVNTLLEGKTPEHAVDVLVNWDEYLDVQGQTSGDCTQIQVDINPWKSERVSLTLAHELVHVAQTIKQSELSLQEMEVEAYSLESLIEKLINENSTQV